MNSLMLTDLLLVIHRGELNFFEGRAEFFRGDHHSEFEFENDDDSGLDVNVSLRRHRGRRS